ncbi:MAG: hypothetical protein BGO49_27790 [Planctomycetales bacterium 71-10]|nr:MAG: hypothetical protein BGO49_27790 [Planctomycetales bacterium 71-10]
MPPESPDPRAFFTIGYGGRPPEEFVGLLRAHGVRTVADVRIKPERASMGAYTKAKAADKGIEKLLADAGVGYRSLPELGNVFLDMDDWTAPYSELIARAGDLLTRRLVELPGPFCLLCAEKRVADCHRRTIADHLVGRGWSVTHIE